MSMSFHRARWTRVAPARLLALPQRRLSMLRQPGWLLGILSEGGSVVVADIDRVSNDPADGKETANSSGWPHPRRVIKPWCLL